MSGTVSGASSSNEYTGIKNLQATKTSENKNVKPAEFPPENSKTEAPAKDNIKLKEGTNKNDSLKNLDPKIGEKFEKFFEKAKDSLQKLHNHENKTEAKDDVIQLKPFPSNTNDKIKDKHKSEPKSESKEINKDLEKSGEPIKLKGFPSNAKEHKIEEHKVEPKNEAKEIKP